MYYLDFGGSPSAVLCCVRINLVCIKQCMIWKTNNSQELANVTRTSERYIREWLANQEALVGI